MKPRYGKVKDLPFIFGILSREKLNEIKLREEVGLQPRNMDYRKEFIKGHGASTKDPTWNREKHIHTCCFSKATWRHKAKCKKVLREDDDFSDLKDII